MISMAQIITFVFLLGFNTVISKPIYGNLYEEQILHEQIEQHEHSATHEVPATCCNMSLSACTHGNRSLNKAKLKKKSSFIGLRDV